MYCPYCGNETKDDAAFCNSCGSPLSANQATRQNAFTPVVQTPAAQAPAQAVAVASDKQKQNKVILIAAVVAALVVALVASGLFLTKGAESKRSNARHAVQFAIVADGYNDSTDTRFPVRVAGTGAQGNAVDELFFVGSDGKGVEVGIGTYEVTFPAGSITESGDIFKPGDGQVVRISVGEEIDTSTTPIDGGQIGYVRVPVNELTDDLINITYEYGKRDPNDGGKADKLKQNVDQKVAQKKAEEEAARKQAEEKAAQEAASRNFSCEYFTITPPESFGAMTYNVRNFGGDGHIYALDIISSAVGEKWSINVVTTKIANSVNIGEKPWTTSQGYKIFLTGTDYKDHDKNEKLRPYINPK